MPFRKLIKDTQDKLSDTVAVPSRTASTVSILALGLAVFAILIACVAMSTGKAV